MKIHLRIRRRLETVLAVIAGLLTAPSQAVELPAAWRQVQSFTVETAGLVKFSLPVATIDAAQPGLEDLRIYDNAGAELPLLVERPAPAARTIQAARSFQVALQPGATVITLETGLTQPVEAVTLESPAVDFIKPIKVEGSRDGRNWRTLAQGRPIFRQAGGASELRVSFPADTGSWLRLTVDDQRTTAVPFTGARVHAAAGATAPSESLAVRIIGRDESPGETRLRLDLGAANLDLVSLQLETSEPLFTRAVTLAVAQIENEAIHEQRIGAGVIYRVALEEQPASSNLTVAIGRQIRARELLVLIRNHDSPPLPITATRVERRPVQVAFRARAPGVHHLLVGNRTCAAPRYDLAALSADLKSIPVRPLELPPLAENPGYRPPEVLPQLETNGLVLDIKPWRFRKAVMLTHTGVQQVELDTDVMAHAQPDFGDLRLLRLDRQVPYVLERTSVTRALTPEVVLTNDVKDRTLSRWLVKLPRVGLPVNRLSFAARSTLFERSFIVVEFVADARGEKFRRELGRATWVRTSERASRELVIPLERAPETDALWLETRNGDNPPVELENFRLYHPVTRILFKGNADDDLLLYYGQPEASAPRYDVNLVAGQLLAAERHVATLVAEEQLRAAPRSERRLPGSGGVLFWGILAVVVIGLLFVIARLLPKSSPPPPA